MNCSANFSGWLSHDEMPDLPHRVAVGWSGGADSTALLLALKQAGHAVTAWHVDHGWRSSSPLESELLDRRAKAWGIPFISVCLEPASGKNREAEARRGRYAQFLAMSRASGISTLALAHHLDDQAETVCMRLLQGAGAGGCRGMQRQRHYYGMRIVRPLLHVGAEELREALKQADIPWFEDPSNDDRSIWRNRIRHELFPRMAATGVEPVELFLRWQQQAERLADRLDAGVEEVMKVGMEMASSEEGGGVSLSWRQWSAAPAPVRARLLQRMMAMLLGEGVTPGRRHIVLVEQWTQRQGCGGLDLSRCRLQRRQGGLHLLPRASVCGEHLC